MPFLRANVIPVNPQIHANVMRPLLTLFLSHCLYMYPISFISLNFFSVPSLIKYVDIVNAELIESTLKQTIMCT
jgi:hypothetical protein